MHFNYLYCHAMQFLLILKSGYFVKSLSLWCKGDVLAAVVQRVLRPLYGLYGERGTCCSAAVVLQWIACKA